MSGQDISITATEDGAFGAYLASPARIPAPGIVLIQEIFGVNGVMRGIADALAGDGFVVLCPDLFWRQQPGIQITDRSPAEWDRAFELFQGFDLDLGVADLMATLDHLRGLDACTGKVGAVGFCLGGQLAYLMACRSNVDAAAGYYGVRIQDFLGEAANISKPLMLHIAGEDQFVPPEAQEAVVSGLGDRAGVVLHRYPGRDHAFARVGGEHYHRESADLANRRTLDFLTTHLAEPTSDGET